MKQQILNEKLMDAIAAHDLKAVRECLAKGADPNYTMYPDEEEPNGYIQPTTPLRLVMFCISDSFIGDHELKVFAEIAKLLLSYGADAIPAMQIAELRYGKYDPYAKGSFMDVWHIVAKGVR